MNVRHAAVLGHARDGPEKKDCTELRRLPQRRGKVSFEDLLLFRFTSIFKLISCQECNAFSEKVDKLAITFAYPRELSLEVKQPDLHPDSISQNLTKGVVRWKTRRFHSHVLIAFGCLALFTGSVLFHVSRITFSVLLGFRTPSWKVWWLFFLGEVRPEFNQFDGTRSIGGRIRVSSPFRWCFISTSWTITNVELQFSVGSS